MKKGISSGEPSKMNRVLNIIKKILLSKWFRVIVIFLVIFFVAKTAVGKIIDEKFNKTQETTVQTAKVEKRDIQNALSSSGTIEPLNTYEVTTLVEGEVISADFEEGDQVKKGDVLYRITTDSVDKQIESSQTSLDRANEKYEKAVENYDDAVADYNDAKADLTDSNVKAEASGKITEVFVEKGDTIQNGTQIAKIYDSSYMLLSIPFSSSDVSDAWVGKTATVKISETGKSLKGTVTKVSSVERALTGNRIVKDVTIKVKNTGGIATTTAATATVGKADSYDEGTFSALVDTTITSKLNGDIKKLNIKEGDTVKKGDVIVTFKTDEDQLESYQKSIDSAKDNVESARESVEDAESNLEDQKNKLTDYSVTAPISGQIIKKNTLVGDTVKSSGDNSALCVIYDLSSLTFQMSIDELDIKSVEVGQEVEITADALENEQFTGTVTNISLEATTSNGVTDYPVTVRIDDTGDLLPGMNVTGEIIIEKVEGAIAVPVDALMRGNKVYVKDDSVTEAVGDVPAGFKEVEVETGISDEDYIEIKSGLEGDEEVYVVRASGGTDTMMVPGGMQGGMQGGGFSGGERPSGNSGKQNGGGNSGGFPGN